MVETLAVARIRRTKNPALRDSGTSLNLRESSPHRRKRNAWVGPPKRPDSHLADWAQRCGQLPAVRIVLREHHDVRQTGARPNRLEERTHGNSATFL